MAAQESQGYLGPGLLDSVVAVVAGRGWLGAQVEGPQRLPHKVGEVGMQGALDGH